MAHRSIDHDRQAAHGPAWWVIGAWASLAVLAVAGLVGALGV